jgi:hypothetical protein
MACLYRGVSISGRCALVCASDSTCVAAYGAGWSCDRAEDQNSNEVNVCQPMTSGGLAIGDPCLEASQCASGYCNGSWCDTACTNDTQCDEPFAICNVPFTGGTGTGYPHCSSGDCAIYGNSAACTTSGVESYCDTTCQGLACGASRECFSSSQCTIVPGRPLCDTTAGQCVQCVSASDCSGGADCVNGLCGHPCATSAECVGVSGLPYCSPATGRCVACLGSAQCPSGRSCQSNICEIGTQNCAVDGDCGTNKVCNPDTLLCVGCLSSSDCRRFFGMDVCNPANLSCVGCLSTADCGTGQSCVGTQCVNGSFCSTDAQCTGTLAHCNTSTGQCVACTSTSQCGSGATCVNNACQTTTVTDGGHTDAGTADAGTPDAGSGNTGTDCVTLVNCLGPCTTQACVNTCAAAASSTAISEYNNIVSCVGSACPTTSGGVCASSSQACDNCQTAAEQSGGACGAQIAACVGSSGAVDAGTPDAGPPNSACGLQNGQYVYDTPATCMGHSVGRADSDGWSATTGRDSPGHLTYGPYTTDIPAGNWTATTTLLIDNNNPSDSSCVANLDVNDFTAGAVLASTCLARNQFSAANQYEDFNVFFTNVAGHKLEFRVWWEGNAYLREQKVVVH